jgi:hypothetical protein
MALESKKGNGSQSRTGGRDQEEHIPLGRVQIAYAMQVSVWSSGPIETISINRGISVTAVLVSLSPGKMARCRG